MKHLYILAAWMLTSITASAQTSDFESLPLAAESNWDGSDLSGSFTNGNAVFKNTFLQSPWGGYWAGGFGYANETNTSDSTYTNIFTPCTGSGVGKSKNYAIGHDTNSVIVLTGVSKTVPVTGFYITNTIYAVHDMKHGTPGVSKKFGGLTGNEQDWFKVAITGYRNNLPTGDTVKVYLADFRFADNSKDYILTTWRWIDLRSLGAVDSLKLILASSDTGDWGMNTPSYYAIDHFNEPLYDKAVVNGGTAAIFKDSPLFQSWATSCTVTRGYMDITNPAGGLASSGPDVNGTLKAGVNSSVSLGDGGSAVLQFAVPVQNGAGPDFAVFENGFDSGTNQFLELAFVEVSSNGVDYVRFPAISKTNAFTQTGSFAPTDASLLYNLAGKYVANYGTPFDLEELKSNPLLDVNNITHIRLVDVIGSIDAAISSKDSLGNPVNDPFKTAFASSGFDLDAVGVINQNNLSTAIVKNADLNPLNIYPNPSSSFFTVSMPSVSATSILEVTDVNGMVVFTQTIGQDAIQIDAAEWKNGIYYIRAGEYSQKIVKIQ